MHNQMKSIGIVGFGSMGSMFAKAFLRAGCITEESLYIHTRTPQRAAALSSAFPGVQVNIPLSVMAAECQYLLICVPPREVASILSSLSPYKERTPLIISLAGSVTLSMMEMIFPGRFVRMVPSITAEADSGITIFTCNDRCTPQDAEDIMTLFHPMGEVMMVGEASLEAYTDVTSCSPGIISAMFKEYLDAAVQVGNLPPDQAEHALICTLQGLIALYTNHQMSFDDVIQRVARKGGTTEIGVRLVREQFSITSREIIEQTLERQMTRREALEQDFAGTVTSPEPTAAD